MRKYIEESLELAESSANWNRERGYLTEAYGWESRVAELYALAYHLRIADLAEKAHELKIKLRDLREAEARSLKAAG